MEGGGGGEEGEGRRLIRRKRERGITVADNIISKTKERNNFANSNSSD